MFNICRRRRHPAQPGRCLMDPYFWKACAGAGAYVPTVDSYVFYFPQGHAEQAATPPKFLPHHLVHPAVHCRVLSVDLLADKETEEVFAHIRLGPVSPSHALREPAEPAAENRSGPRAYAKVLTPSDANNGGGFSVPRGCADSVFPPLDLTAVKPLQYLQIHDPHGQKWNFRHIYRGTPRRHLLTTGWSKFVNAKQLVADDTVVFGAAGDTHLVGIRRTVRPGGGWGRGRVSAEEVVGAAEKAVAGKVFEVVYYPDMARPPFLVDATTVRASARSWWAVGAKVKMVIQANDASTVSHFNGTIEAINISNKQFPDFPSWRMLQVKWDQDSELVKNFRHVSPWQLELESDHMAYSSPPKKLRSHMDFFHDHIPPFIKSPPNAGSGFGFSGMDHALSIINTSVLPKKRRTNLAPVSTEARANNRMDDDVSTDLCLASSSKANSGRHVVMLFGKEINNPESESGCCSNSKCGVEKVTDGSTCRRQPCP